MKGSKELNRELVLKVLAKAKGETSEEWVDISESYSEAGYAGETLRKASPLLVIADELGMVNHDKIDADAVERIAIEKQKNHDLKLEIGDYQRRIARSEALRDAVIEAAKLSPPVEIKLGERHPTNNKRRLVVSIADFHYGAEWEIKGLYGETVNKYNPEIFEMRMQLLLEEIIDIMHREDVYDIVVLMCGDSLDGMIRQTQLMKLRYGVVESCMRFADYMVAWLKALAFEANSVGVYNVLANHPEVRPFGTKRGEYEDENFEKIITWHLASKFEENDKVAIYDKCERTTLIDICGYKCILTHGDDATLAALAKQSILLYGEKIDFFFTGHKHNEVEMQSGYTEDGNSYIFRTPSICGTDGFAQKLMKGGKPGATVVVMEEQYGRRCVYPVKL